MKATRPHRGSWGHRLLVYCFTVLFGVLIYWLLGFVMRDIGTWPGPDYADVEKQLGDPQLTREAASLATQIEDANRSRANRQQRQTVLRDSTSNSEKTMNQLLGFQRLTLEKGLTPSAESTKALTESQQLFLANQTKYQELNEQIAAINEQLTGLQDRQREVKQKIEAQRPAIQKEYNHLQTAHNWKVAACKLAVLVPLLAVAVWLFLKKRGSLYAPLSYGFGLALLVRVTLVMHEHFPRRYFKYILVVVAIVLVTYILVYLLRTMAFPKMDWLLKQYRDAYEHFFCPVCGYPIRRGPRQHLFWSRGSLKKLALPASPSSVPEDTYTCPSCASALFETCPACQKVRHSLLPACCHCGAIKEIQPPAEKRA